MAIHKDQLPFKTKPSSHRKYKQVFMTVGEIKKYW